MMMTFVLYMMHVILMESVKVPERTVMMVIFVLMIPVIQPLVLVSTLITKILVMMVPNAVIDLTVLMVNVLVMMLSNVSLPIHALLLNVMELLEIVSKDLNQTEVFVKQMIFAV